MKNLKLQILFLMNKLANKKFAQKVNNCFGSTASFATKAQFMDTFVISLKKTPPFVQLLPARTTTKLFLQLLSTVTGEQRPFPSRAASFIMNHRVEALITP